MEEQEAQERLRFENEYERSRRESLERMKEEEERRKEKERERVEFLRRQMEELKVRDEEVSLNKTTSIQSDGGKIRLILYMCLCVFQSRRLQQEEDALLTKRLEVEQLEEDRRRAEESRKKSEFG